MRIFSGIKTSLYGATALLGLLIVSGGSCYAQTDYFIQNFSEVVGYTSTTPNNTQFNTLGASNNASATVSEGKLVMTRGATPAQAFFLRNTNFSPVPSTLYLEVDIGVPTVVANINGAAIFNIGRDFTSAGSPANAEVFARFSINLGVNNTFQIRNVPGVPGGSTANSTTFPNTRTVKVIVAMNNGNTPITYFDPRDANAPQMVLQPGTYDIWVENEPLRLGRVKVAGEAGNVTLTNFNFQFNMGEGTITMDNLRIRDISGVLPVKLTNFNAEAIGNKVELVWETTWEKNSREFVVQRSSDLKEFGDIGRVAAAGAADGRRAYSFVDTDPLPGANYYRLRMVDKDDTYEYSKVKDVVVRSDQPTLLVASNPTTGDRIRVRVASVDVSALRLTNIMGQNIRFKVDQNSDGYTELIPSAVLAPGMYFLSSSQEGSRAFTKVLVQH
jgi:hypothetical protein